MTSADLPTLHRRAHELLAEGDKNGARIHFQAGLLLDPQNPACLADLGYITNGSNQLKAAKVFSEKVLALTPDDAVQWSNYGNTLTQLELYSDAEAALRKSIDLASDSVMCWYNLALFLHRFGRESEAHAALDMVEALGHGTSQVKEDRAHFYLAEGNLPKALELYEHRWNSLMHLEPWDFHLPEWQGESLDGRTIMVHHEQGFGDTIMTVRFVRNLCAKYPTAKVLLAVPPALVTLFSAQSWPRVSVVNMHNLTKTTVAGVDFHSPLWSMVRWLEITKEQISGEPYLTVPKTVIGARVDPRMVNIGICWASGRRNSTLDVRRRVSSLEDWLPLGAHPRIQLHNLWKDGDAQEEIEAIGAGGLVQNCVDDLQNFADTAVFVDQLDFVVGVDTAIIHLAGALGKPTWLISHLSNCWRWWGLKRGSGAPWYDSVGIFQQPKPQDWKTPLLWTTNTLHEIVDREESRRVAA